MRTATALLIAVAAAVAPLGAASAASAETGPSISAAPASIEVGEIATVTATGLGDLETATFGLGDVSGTNELSVDGETWDTLVEAPAQDGTASASFRANQPGDYTVTVTNGETPLAETTVTVTAAASPTTPPATSAAPTETPSPSASASATPVVTDAADSTPAWVVPLIIVVVLLVVAAILVTVIVQSRRRRPGAGR